MRRLLASLLVLAPSLAFGYTETFYVCEGGDGTLPETPTCATAYDAADFSTAGNWDTDDSNDGLIGPNDRVVLLDDGGDVRGNLVVQGSGLSGKPITIEGETASSSINGTDVISGWTSGPNVWQAADTDEPEQVFLDGVRAIDETGACPGDVDADTEWCWSANVIYLYSATDPDSRWTEVEAGNDDACIEMWNRDYVTIKNLRIEKGESTGAVVIGNDSDYWIISGVTIEYAHQDGIWIWTGTTPSDGGKLLNSELAYNAGNGINANPATDLLVQGNLVHHNALYDDAEHVNVSGIKVVQAVSTGLIIENNITHTNGVASANQQGCGIWLDTQVQGPIIRYNLSYDNQYFGIFCELCDDGEIYYNITYGQSGRGASSGIAVWGSSATAERNEVYNNVSYGNDFAGIFMSGDGGGCSDNVVKNNLTLGNTWELYAVEGCDNDLVLGSGNVYEYNGFGPESANFIQWDVSTFYSTYDAWLAASSQTDTNMEATPLFVDASGGDFSLESGSPARDAGFDVGLSQDYVGNAVPTGSAPDLGAYEFFGIPGAPAGLHPTNRHPGMGDVHPFEQTVHPN